MASKTVEVILKAKDAISGTLTGVRKSLGDFGKFASGVAAGIGASFGALALGRFFASSVQEAANAERSWAAVGAAIRNVGGDAKAARPEVDKLVNSLSLLSGKDDEAVSDALTRLITLTGDYRKALGLLPTALDVAAGRNIDLAAASDLVAKAANGNTVALTRMGMRFKEGADLVQVLRDRYAGFAAEEGQTLQGTLGRIATAWGNLKEEVGRALTGGDAFRDGGNRLVQTLVDLEGWIRRNEGAISEFVSLAVDAATATAKWLGELVRLNAFTFNPSLMTSQPLLDRLQTLERERDVAAFLNVLGKEKLRLTEEVAAAQERFNRAQAADIGDSGDPSQELQKASAALADLKAELGGVSTAFDAASAKLQRMAKDAHDAAVHTKQDTTEAVTALDDHAKALVALAQAERANAEQVTELLGIEAALQRTVDSGTTSIEDRVAALAALKQVQDALGRKVLTDSPVDPKAPTPVTAANPKDETRTVTYQSLDEAKLAPLSVDVTPKLDKAALDDVTQKVGAAVVANGDTVADGYRMAQDAVAAFGNTFASTFSQVLSGNATLFGAIAKGGRAAIGSVASAKSGEAFIDAANAFADGIWKPATHPGAFAAGAKKLAVGSAYAALAATLGGRSGGGGVGSAGGGGGGGLTPGRFESDAGKGPQNTLTIVLKGGSSRDVGLQDWILDMLKNAEGRGVTVVSE